MSAPSKLRFFAFGYRVANVDWRILSVTKQKFMSEKSDSRASGSTNTVAQFGIRLMRGSCSPFLPVTTRCTRQNPNPHSTQLSNAVE